MKAYDLYKCGQPNIPPGNDFKTLPIPKVEIDMKPVNKNSDPNLIPNTTKNRANPFPWKGVCVLGLVLVCSYLFLKIPPKYDYRRRRRSSYRHHPV